MAWIQKIRPLLPGDMLVPEWFATARRAGESHEALYERTRQFCAAALASRGDTTLPDPDGVDVIFDMYLSAYGEESGAPW